MKKYMPQSECLRNFANSSIKPVAYFGSGSCPKHSILRKLGLKYTNLSEL